MAMAAAVLALPLPAAALASSALLSPVEPFLLASPVLPQPCRGGGCPTQEEAP